MNKKVLLGCVLLAICVMCGPQFVHAWGSDGHKIVAQIAQQFMSPIAWSACKAQLVWHLSFAAVPIRGMKLILLLFLVQGNLNLADIATLPDSYDHNSDGSWSSHLHFANLPGTFIIKINLIQAAILMGFNLISSFRECHLFSTRRLCCHWWMRSHCRLQLHL